MCSFSRGFSLIEIVLVLSLCSLLAGWALFASFSSIGRTSLAGETETLVLVLQKARANAMSNIDAAPWGVCSTGTTYRLFSGPSYATRLSEETLPEQSSATDMDCASGGLVFEQLSGQTHSTTVHIIFADKTKEILINHEGRIETN